MKQQDGLPVFNLPTRRFIFILRCLGQKQMAFRASGLLASAAVRVSLSIFLPLLLLYTPEFSSKQGQSDSNTCLEERPLTSFDRCRIGIPIGVGDW